MKGTSTSTTRRNSIFLFLIWPFFALWYALKNYRAHWAKDILWLFVIFYGFTFVVPETRGQKTIDAVSYKDRFEEMAWADDFGFVDIVASLYSEDEEGEQHLDILDTIIMFVVSRVSSNYHTLFAVFGLVFGYFYSRNIWFLIETIKQPMVKINVLLILTFSFVVGFWQINGFRFWTATQIFLYGTLPYIMDGNKKRLLFSGLAALMHFSFLAPIGVLLAYTVIGNRMIPFFILFVMTFFVQQLNITAINEALISRTPQVFMPRVESYTGEAYREKISTVYESVNWYIRLYNTALKWSVALFLIAIFATGRKTIKKYKSFNNLFCFTLFIYSFANIFSLIPSGARFISVANLFAVGFIFFYLQFVPRSTLLKRVILLSTPALILFITVSIRIGFDTMGFFCVLGNPLLSFFVEADITMIATIKNILGVKI